jgi:mercuric ion transport protein
MTAAVSAVVAGLAAISCCVMPLIFVLVGVGGAWIANFTALSPYQPIFITVAVAAIAYGHLTAYRARRACAAGTVCARSMPRWIVNGGLWTGTALIAIAVTINLLAPYLI